MATLHIGVRPQRRVARPQIDSNSGHGNGGQQAVGIVESGHLSAYWTSALVFAAAARAAVTRGEMREARRYVQRAASLRPLLTYVLPVVSVQALLELAHAYAGLTDPSGALAALDAGGASGRLDLLHPAPALHSCRCRSLLKVAA